MLLSRQIGSAFIEAGWMRDRHLSVDQSVEELEFTPVSDRGCNIATAGDPRSLAVRDIVFQSLKSEDLECSQNVVANFLSGSVSVEIGLR
jgi:hypothetical protein